MELIKACLVFVFCSLVQRSRTAPHEGGEEPVEALARIGVLYAFLNRLAEKYVHICVAILFQEVGYDDKVHDIRIEAPLTALDRLDLAEGRPRVVAKIPSCNVPPPSSFPSGRRQTVSLLICRCLTSK